MSGPADAPTDFASDNHAGAHPEVLEAIAAANAGHAGAYGADPWTARAEAPEPPLVTSVDPVLLVVGALAAAGAAALLVALTTRRAFSDAVTGRGCASADLPSTGTHATRSAPST